MSRKMEEALLAELAIIYKKQQTEVDMQIAAAKVFRKYALQYLKFGSGPTAVGFRGTIKHGDLADTYQNFFEQQSRNGAWATYIEASAIAELLAMNLVVTAINAKGEANTFALHRAESDTAPTLHLRNITNSHWDYKGKALPDGNCLYNAIALAHYDAQPRKAVAAKPEKSFEEAKQAWQAIKLQSALLAKFPTPTERLETIEKEQARIAKLPAAEQIQIEADRQYAIQLALEDAQPIKFKKTQQSTMSRSEQTCATEAKKVSSLEEEYISTPRLIS